MESTTKTITIDCRHVSSQAQFWATYLDQVRPDGASYFGRNLAAFRDALGGGPGWPNACALRFINTASVKSLDNGQFYKSLQEIIKTSKSVNIELE